MKIKTSIQSVTVFFYLISLMLTSVVHAESDSDGMRVYYVHKKNGNHIGFQFWEGSRVEHKVLSRSIADMIKDKYQLDSVTVAPIYPNRCGVLFYDPSNKSKTQYIFFEHYKSLAEAKEYAQEKIKENYKIKDVACSPRGKELQSNVADSITCSDGTNVKYKFIVPPKSNKRVAVILRGGGATIVFSESDLKRIDEQKIARAICPGKATKDGFNTFTSGVISYLKQFSRDNCIKKHGSEKACQAWMKTQVKRNGTYLSGVRG